MNNRFVRFARGAAFSIIIALFAAAPQFVAAQTPSKEDILALQEALADAGFKPGRPDGVMGRQTRSAMAQFLKSQQLDPSASETESLEALADFRDRRDRQYKRFSDRLIEVHHNAPYNDRTRELITMRLAVPTTQMPHAIFKDWDGRYVRLDPDGSVQPVPFRPTFAAVRDGNPLEVLLQFINLDDEAAEPQTPETVCDAAMIKTFFQVGKDRFFADGQARQGSDFHKEIPSVLTIGVRQPSLTEHPYLWCVKWTMELADLAEGYRLPEAAVRQLAEYEAGRIRQLNRDLLDAARRLTAIDVQQWLDEGAEINTVDDKGDTALSLAARRGDLQIVELALQSGASPDVQPAAGGSPLIDAAAGGHRALVGTLLRAGARIDLKDSEGRTALFRSAARGDIETVTLLLEHGADPNDRRDNGVTALMIAAESGSTDLVELLLANGADVNAKAGSGETALHAAVAKRRSETANALLRAGAAADVANGLGETPLDTAINAGAADLARLLVAQGARVDRASVDGRTPLIRAASLGSRELVAFLLDSGADPQARAADGHTALELSSDYGVAATLAGATGSEDALDGMRFVLPHRRLAGKLSLRLPPGTVGRGCPDTEGQPLTGLQGFCFDPPVHPIGDVESFAFGRQDIALASTTLQDGWLQTKEFGAFEFLIARTGRIDVYATGAQIRQLLALAGE